MPLAHTIEFAPLDELYLDPANPRLGRANSGPSVPQQRVMELMRSWTLEELAVSFLQSGFWPQEAVIVVNEPLYGSPDKHVVVEGNRRIAALKYLRESMGGNPITRGWRQIADGAEPGKDLFTRIPYILADSREDVTAYIGFRHVTGIKEWDPAEKADYIARMVDERELSYESIRKQIGSQLETVRRNYIAYRMLRQLDSLDTEVSQEGLERRFSVLFLSLRESGVQSFLGINIRAEPAEALHPIPSENEDNFSHFAIWLFGTDYRKPLFSDSRDVGDFGRILSVPDAVDYLRDSPDPSFDLALQKAGVEQEEVANQLKEASNQMELALSRVHLHLDSEDVQKAIQRLARNAKELILKFPSVAQEVGMRTGEGGDA